MVSLSNHREQSAYIKICAQEWRKTIMFFEEEKKMRRVRPTICLAVVCVMAVVNFASADTIRGINMDFVTIGNAGNAADTRSG